MTDVGDSSGAFQFNFDIFDCTESTIIPSNQPDNFQYRIGTGEGGSSFVWDEWSFDNDSRCLVDLYDIECTDPNGNKITYDSSGTFSNDVSNDDDSLCS